ncbi:MAG: DUF4872 domain-containing protein [Candidatus Binatia bacterium]
MYSEFLESAHQRLPDLVDAATVEDMRRSAASWTQLSGQLAAAGVAEGKERAGLIEQAQATASGIAALETGIFETLLRRATTG